MSNDLGNILRAFIFRLVRPKVPRFIMIGYDKKTIVLSWSKLNKSHLGNFQPTPFWGADAATSEFSRQLEKRWQISTRNLQFLIRHQFDLFHENVFFNNTSKNLTSMTKKISAKKSSSPCLRNWLFSDDLFRYLGQKAVLQKNLGRYVLK